MRNLEKSVKDFFGDGIWTAKEIEERLWDMLCSTVCDDTISQSSDNWNYMSLYRNLCKLLREIEPEKNSTLDNENPINSIFDKH